MSDIDDATLAHREGLDAEAPEEETAEEKPPLSERLHDAIERETEAAEADTPDEAQAFAHALEAAMSEYRGKLAGLLGDIPIEVCGLCKGFGFTAVQLRPDPQVSQCQTCGGHGTVLTGSLVESSAQRPCPTCNGHGFAANAPSPIGATPAQAPAQVRILTAEEVAAAVASGAQNSAQGITPTISG